MRDQTVFLDVDTQRDFMLPAGALYVPGAEKIIPNLKKLMGFAREHQVPVLSTADAHPAEDPSFVEWPPHCVVGTPGQKRIAETQFPGAVVVPNRAGAFSPPRKWSGQTIIEKVQYEVSSNPNFDAVLDSLRASLGGVRFIVFGVATEYCVRGAVLALAERRIPVEVVEDAIRGITDEGARKALDEMAAAGARLVRTEDVCSVKVPHVAG